MTQSIVDYTFLENTVWRLKALYPMLRVKTIGKSVVGRSLYTLEIGRETAPAVLLCGTFWGTDQISGGILLRFAERLLWSLTNNRNISDVEPSAIFENRKIVILPILNPDGREICARGAHCGGIDSGRVRRLCGGNTQNWDANARGVTLSGNFDWNFEKRRCRQKDKGIYGPSSFGYGGPSPESEPETVAICNFCRKQSLLYTVNFYGGNGRVYWYSGEGQGDKSQQMARVLSLCAGYETEVPMGKIVDTGFRNWFCKTVRRPSLDVMLDCKQGNQSAEELYPALEEMLTIACLL